MTANVKVGLLFFQNVFHLRHVVSGITTDVGHIDIGIFDVEKQVLGILHADYMVVNIAVDGTQRLEVGQGVSRFNVADVACMPQFINVFEKVEKLWDENAMCIRQDADALHV